MNFLSEESSVTHGHTLAAARLAYLRGLCPFLLDASLRECAAGSPLGQTLQDKMLLLPRLRRFGFRHIILGSLNYSLPGYLQVDDDFMRQLRDDGADLSGCYALTELGRIAPNGVYLPSASEIKLREYGVPNAVIEIYLGDAAMAAHEGIAAYQKLLAAGISWLAESVRGEAGAAPGMIINIVDGCDAFAQNRERTCALLRFLRSLPIQGISIEDGRGTFLPFQVGEYVALARAILPKPMLVLVHIHSGAGMENAAVIEALLQGADGMWGAMSKRTGVNGHASVSELMVTLARLGNTAMEQYQLADLLALSRQIHDSMHDAIMPDDIAVLGANAYRMPLPFFRQEAGRFMDLAPESIGGAYRYRICPVISNAETLAGRLAEITNQPAESFPAELLTNMIAMMRASLREGRKIAYDHPQHLLALYEDACQPAAF